ncbi:MAG: hypothetical protein ACK5KQ_02420 [Anaerorhabdus sp.]
MDLINRTHKPTILCGIGLSIIAIFFDYRYSLSIMLGVLVSMIHLNRLNRNITNGLANRSGKGKWFMMITTDLLLLAAPFIIAAMLPKYFDLIGVAVGLIINKVIIYIIGLRSNGGDNYE